MNLRRLFLCVLLCALAGPMQAQTFAREFMRAESAWDKEDYVAAETHFTSALKLSAGNSDDEAHAYFGRGAARLQQEKWASARDDLTASIALAPDNAQAIASRGMARKALGDYSGLLEDAHRAAQIDPAEFAGFEDDAKSTVNWRRSLLGFVLLGCVVLGVGLVPLVRGITRAAKGERDSRLKSAENGSHKKS